MRVCGGGVGVREGDDQRQRERRWGGMDRCGDTHTQTHTHTHTQRQRKREERDRGGERGTKRTGVVGEGDRETKREREKERERERERDRREGGGRGTEEERGRGGKADDPAVKARQVASRWFVAFSVFTSYFLWAMCRHCHGESLNWTHWLTCPALKAVLKWDMDIDVWHVLGWDMQICHMLQTDVCRPHSV
jgi:hypothetical protein